MAGKRRKEDSPSPSDPEPKKQAQRTRKQPQQPRDQEQSYFFRLPWEIREMIYRQICIFPVTLHLAYTQAQPRKFRSFLCRVARDSPPKQYSLYKLSSINHHRCSLRKNPNSREISNRIPGNTKRQRTVLALLLTCQRIYNETIDMLYQKNRFYIESSCTLLELPRALSPARLSSLRHLYLESPWYGVGYNNASPDLLEEWAEVIAVLPKLDGLRCLVVILRPISGLDWEIEALRAPLEAAQLPVLRTIIRPIGCLTPTHERQQALQTQDEQEQV